MKYVIMLIFIWMVSAAAGIYIGERILEGVTIIS